MRSPCAVRAAGRAVAACACLALAGCATLRATIDGYGSGPQGISRSQYRLRQALAHDDFVAALAWRESDALLHSLTTATAAYYAQQFARSGAVLDTAALLADDRITASLSRDGLALLTNDLARPYQPRRTERLFIPYYAMLSYVRLEAWEDAAVEARRLLSLLDQYATDRDAAERSLHGALAYLAAVVLERAGERSASPAAYRVAASLDSALATLPRSPSHGEGDVLLVVERGFVPHRVTETIELCLADCDGEDRAHRRRGGGHASAEGGGSLVRMPHRDSDSDDAARRHVTIAFPVLRRAPLRFDGPLALAVDGAVAGTPSVTASLDGATTADANREIVAVAARMTARALAKEAMTRVIAEKKGELAGSIASAGASLLERSDVRSWHLLPLEVTLLRLRVPAGTHALRLVAATGEPGLDLELGSVVVRAGTVVIVPVRVWPGRAPPRTQSVVPSTIATADGVRAISSSP